MRDEVAMVDAGRRVFRHKSATRLSEADQERGVPIGASGGHTPGYSAQFTSRASPSPAGSADVGKAMAHRSQRGTCRMAVLE